MAKTKKQMDKFMVRMDINVSDWPGLCLWRYSKNKLGLASWMASMVIKLDIDMGSGLFIILRALRVR